MKLKNFLFIKKNKNTCFIKDGLIKYKILLNKFPKCICMKNDDFCDHLIFYLNNIIGLDETTIYLLENKDLKQELSNIELNENNILETCNNFLKNNDCGICLDNLLNNQLYKCNYCKKISHLKCIQQWIKKNNIQCIYCKKDMII